MKRWKRKKLPLALSTAIGTTLFCASPGVLAVDQYLVDFNGLYVTDGTALDSCLVCHVNADPNANGTAQNAYGGDFGAAKTSNNTIGVVAALRAIEGLDSDLDAIINIDEITGLTFPGDCTDPDPAGCDGGIPPEPPPGTITEGPTLVGCYEWDRYPDERFALSIKRYGGLVTTEPRNDFIEGQNQTNQERFLLARRALTRGC